MQLPNMSITRDQSPCRVLLLLFLSLLLLLCSAPCPAANSFSNSLIMQRMEAIGMALNAIASARSSASAYAMMNNSKLESETRPEKSARQAMVSAFVDCARFYEDGERRLRQLLVAGSYDLDDARTWLSAAMTGHSTCVEGLLLLADATAAAASAAASSISWNVTETLRHALAVHATPGQQKQQDQSYNNNNNSDEMSTRGLVKDVDQQLLVSWDVNRNSYNADLVVAQDGSGGYTTINDAVASLRDRPDLGSRRLVIYIKSGIYHEYVRIDATMTDLMFVGDGIDRTVITGNRNALDGGYTTYSSATFCVSGDYFWARDMTFENTAGPEKQQAVAATVDADRAIFYRCSFKGYQDTLLVNSMRQFYRDCQVHGTIDFIFGNAAAVLQNCDIYVRRPLPQQSNMITAQGRDDPNQNTGISIQASRVRPAADLAAAEAEGKGLFKSYLGRPWKKYARAVFLKTELDGLVDPEGWAKWEDDGDFALDTLFFGEYMNTGEGADTGKRVNWPGFHVLDDSAAAEFTVDSFIQGNLWILESGVPFSAGL